MMTSHDVSSGNGRISGDHPRPSSAARRIIGVAEAWVLFVLGAAIGIGTACTCPPGPELGSMYAIETNLPGWEPDSGTVAIDGDELRVVYRDVDGDEWELVYELP